MHHDEQLATYTMPPNSNNCSISIANGSFPYYHTHNDYWEFTIITSNSYTHHINGEAIPIKRNTFCIIRPEDKHYFIANNEQKAIHINFEVRASYLKQALSLSNENLYGALLKAHAPSIELSTEETNALIRQANIILSSKSEDIEDNLLINLLMIVRFLINHKIYRSDSPVYGPITSQLITLMENPENMNLNVDSLVPLTGYSYPYVSKVFKRETNRSLNSYFQQEKIRYAKKMLSATTYSLSTIAEKLGYSSQYAFSFAFKNNTGISPSEYAKKHKLLHPVVDTKLV